MTFISYAQNSEDVMLWRALKHVESGFYIDVGANDPEIDSVTKAFYERGWHGINIEPLSAHHLALLRDRSRDINLQCAAGSEAGDFSIWECDVRGWATLDKDVVARHERDGHTGEWLKITVRTLEDICAEYVTGEIHFLKVDVEGFESEVLSGMEFSAFRPWIVVVEATVPNSQNENYVNWENLLLNRGYIFVYADGLNRFYVTKEHSELLESLKYPPNVFDGFTTAREHLLSKVILQNDERASEAEAAKLAALELAEQAEAAKQAAINRATRAEATKWEAIDRAARAERAGLEAATQLEQTTLRAWQAEACMNAILASRSWRVTKPVRYLGDQLRLLRQHGPTSRAKAAIKKLVYPSVRSGIRFLMARPRAYSYCVAVAKVFGLYGLLRSVGSRALNPTGEILACYTQENAGIRDVAQLTSSAQEIYMALKDAIEKYKEDN